MIAVAPVFSLMLQKWCDVVATATVFLLEKVMLLESKVISLNTGEANGITDYRHFGKPGEEFEYG